MGLKKRFILLYSCVLVFLVTIPVYAVDLLPSCIDSGNCNLNDITSVFGNIARIILGITGSVALLMFIIGGFYWLTAAGVEARVAKGKQIIITSVIGIVIIFGAYIGVQFLTDVIGSEGISKVGSSCGSNKVYAEKDGDIECITECERDHPTWSCQTKTEITGRTTEERESQARTLGCETSLCPGATNVVCCPRE